MFKLRCLLTLFLCVFLANGQTIKDNFYFCSESNSDMVLNDDSCPEFSPNQEETPIYGKAYILGKMKYPINGKGYLCKARVVDQYGYEVIQLTRSECELMINQKKCKNVQMGCNYGSQGIYCEKQIQSGYECILKEIEILSESNHTQLLNADCDLSKTECVTNDSLIIWDNDIHHQCNYELIEEMNLALINNGVFKTDQGLLFKAIKQHEACGVKILETTVGLYIAFENNNNFQAQKYKLIDVNLRLLTAEQDLRYFNLQYTNCISNLNILKMYKNGINKYFLMKISNNEDKIYYQKDNKIRVPQCEIIKEIQIQEDDSSKLSCPKEIPVFFVKNGLKIKGFLINDNIIISKSNCDDSKKRGYITKNNKYLISYTEEVQEWHLTLNPNNNENINIKNQ